MDNRSAWESEAQAWIRWARTPGHDAYWQYRSAFFEGVMPSPGRHTLEVGCGEGRVARDLVAHGHRVTAADGSPTLVRHAEASDDGARYCVADASQLPFAASSFDLVVAYNALMDFDDMPGAVSEVARVLESGGVFCICVTHPMLNVGAFESRAHDDAYRLTRPYFGARFFDEIEERNGLAMHFTGWSYSLEAYFLALSNAGFVVDLLREPVPESKSGIYERWHRYPMFLHMRASKR